MRAWHALLLFGLVVSVALFTKQHVDSVAAYHDRISACKRGNLIRREIRAQRSVLDDFLTSAAAARDASGDHDVADQYRSLINRLRPLGQIDCSAIIDKPGWLS